jgi:hypothetical protein
MLKNRLNLRKVATIVACLAVMTAFWGCDDKAKFKIGQEYQGGIIAYIDATGEHGLIAAPEDQSIGVTWGKFGSGPGFGTFTTNARATEIWTGKRNTDMIVAVTFEGEYAARLCYDLVLNGYDDWFLPSRDELSELYKNRAKIGGFVSTSKYWSSSEAVYNSAYCQDFSNAGKSPEGGHKISESHRVRAVRYF